MTAPAQKVASLLARNLTFATTWKDPGLLMEGLAKAQAAGRKGTIIISCSDPRITPAAFLGLEFGEGAIIRNAGGRAREALNSILALDAVGNVGTIIVIHHTDCGMSHTDEDNFRAKTEARHPQIAAMLPERVFGAISNPEVTIKEDVEYLKSFPSLDRNMEVFGLVLETKTGVLRQVM